MVAHISHRNATIGTNTGDVMTHMASSGTLDIEELRLIHLSYEY